MEPALIILIVLSSLNLVSNLLSPLVLSGAFLIKNISESSCCGSTLKIRDDPQDIKLYPQAQPNDAMIEMIQRLPKKSNDENNRNSHSDK